MNQQQLTSPVVGMASDDFNNLQQVSAQLKDALSSDESTPDMGDFCFNSNGSQNYAVPPSSSWNILVRKNLLPFPNELYSLYNGKDWDGLDSVSNHLELEARTDMGIFEEIGRAWIVIDKRLILWKFQDGYDWNIYDSDEVIQAVGIVKPKKDVFVEAVSHVLVIVTLSKITILGLSILKDKAGRDAELKLYDADLSTPSENVSYTGVVGTNDGRIFLGAKDGHIYEIDYSTQERWFTAACYKVCRTSSRLNLLLPSAMKTHLDPITYITLDPSRNLLYTLTRNNEISMYNISANEFEHVCTMKNIKSTASRFSLRNPLIETSDFKITSLHPILRQDSRILHLVAFCKNGVRLMFTREYMQARRYVMTEEPRSPLYLLHIRFPPTIRDASGINQPLPIALGSSSICSHHLYLGVHQGDNEEDDLYVFSPDALRTAKSSATMSGGQIMEWTQTFGTEGKICEIKEQPYSSQSLYSNKGTLLPELSTQLLRPQRELWVIASQGVHILRKQRPIDTLQYLLVNKSQHHSIEKASTTELSQFLQAVDIVEALVMTVALICRNKNAYEDGEATAASKEAIMLAEYAKKFLYEHGTAPQATGVGPGMPNTTIPSTRYHATILYMARIVRPIWNSMVAINADAPPRLIPNLPYDTLQEVQKLLVPFQKFVTESAQYYRSTPRQTIGLGDDSGAAWAEEIEGLGHLAELVKQTVEAIAFVMLLIDYKLTDIATELAPNVRRDLAGLTFANLVITPKGREIAKDLVTAMINRQMMQSMDVDAISEALQMRCGSFCSSDDVVLYKAIEHLRRGSNTSLDAGERQRALGASLDLFVKVSSIMTYERIADVCQAYRTAAFYTGGIDLALHRAHTVDKDNLALAYVKGGLLAGDVGNAKLQERNRYYEIALDSLRDLHSKVSEQPTQSTLNMLDDAFLRALSSEDELFHHVLYSWMLSVGMGERLLDIQTPYVESFLSKPPIESERCDLLWRYYVRAHRNGLAAITLQNLAISVEVNPGLSRRVEYLTLAASNARADNQLPKQQVATLFNEINDRLQVARIQVDMLNALRDENYAEDVQQLDSRLMDVSELYTDYAERHHLFDMCLVILAISEYREREEIEDMWTAYITQLFRDGGEEDVPLAEYVSASLGRLLGTIYPSDNVLNLLFLIPLVEGKACARGDVGWVPFTFVDAGMPMDALFEAYEETLYTRPPPFSDSTSVTFLLQETLGLVDRWVTTVVKSGITSEERANFSPPRVISSLEKLDRMVTEHAGADKHKLADDIKDILRRVRSLERQYV